MERDEDDSGDRTCRGDRIEVAGLAVGWAETIDGRDRVVGSGGGRERGGGKCAVLSPSASGCAGGDDVGVAMFVGRATLVDVGGSGSGPATCAAVESEEGGKTELLMGGEDGVDGGHWVKLGVCVGGPVFSGATGAL